jgi:hypothetical protein
VTVDFTNPASIRAWLEQAPERHLPQLRALYRLMPAFREQITAAIPKELARQPRRRAQ